MKQELRALLIGSDHEQRLMETLERQSFSVKLTSAIDPSSVNKALNESRWDLIICETGVPGLSPRKVLDLIRQAGIDPPFFIIAGPDREPDALDAMDRGASDYFLAGNLARLGAAVRREREASQVRAAQRNADAALAERTAELESTRRAMPRLFALSRLMGEDAPFEQLLQRLTEIIPDGWPSPAIPHARVRFDDRDYTSDGFRETARCKKSDIIVRGRVRGTIEVFSTEAHGVSDEDPVCDTEQAILDELAAWIGNAMDRASSEAKIQHLSSVLRAIRRVNRLIVRGQEPAEIVEQVCREIVSPQGIRNAWIHLNGEAPGGRISFESGWKEAFRPLADQLEREHLPRCCQRALEKDDVVIIHDPSSNCKECPLSQQYDISGSRPNEVLATTIRIDGKMYGFLSASVSQDIAPPEEKKTLLREIAEDIAIALCGIEAEIERSRAESALKSEAQRRQVLMNASMDGICIINQEHQVVEANQRFIEMLGYSKEEVLSLHTWDFESMMPKAEIRIAFADLTKTYAIFETKHRRKDGTLYDVEVSASGASVDGEPMVFTVSRDITEKKKLQANLAQSDRLSSMGMLAAGVAHEINNPLTYVLYHLEMLARDVPQLIEQSRRCRDILCGRLGEAAFDQILGDTKALLSPECFEKTKKRLREALDGIRRIREIARSLSIFSRVEREQLVAVDIHYTIECAVNMAFNEIKYRARFTKEFGSISKVMASEGQLSQVFLNLLINAAHAVGEGNVEGNEIRVRTWQEGEEVCVEVRDTGEGIAKEDLDKIYEPFFTTKAIGVGSGLGLTISRNIITDCGGRLEVESEKGKGTSFYVHIPCRPPAPKAISEARLPVEPSVRRLDVESEKVPPLVESSVHGRILVIDDEIGVLNTIKDMLKDHDVVTASSGKSGRKILEVDQSFDLILCDMMMPTMSGWELHKWLVEAHPDLADRLVFITGGAFTPKARDYLTKVNNLCWNKPFEETVFTQEVVKMISSQRKPHARDSRG